MFRFLMGFLKNEWCNYKLFSVHLTDHLKLLFWHWILSIDTCKWRNNLQRQLTTVG